jgi:hypothetical protein
MAGTILGRETGLVIAIHTQPADTMPGKYPGRGRDGYACVCSAGRGQFHSMAFRHERRHIEHD